MKANYFNRQVLDSFILLTVSITIDGQPTYKAGAGSGEISRSTACIAIVGRLLSTCTLPCSGQ